MIGTYIRGYLRILEEAAEPFDLSWFGVGKFFLNPTGRLSPHRMQKYCFLDHFMGIVET